MIDRWNKLSSIISQPEEEECKKMSEVLQDHSADEIVRKNIGPRNQTHFLSRSNGSNIHRQVFPENLAGIQLFFATACFGLFSTGISLVQVNAMQGNRVFSLTGPRARRRVGKEYWFSEWKKNLDTFRPTFFSFVLRTKCGVPVAVCETNHVVVWGRCVL